MVINWCETNWQFFFLSIKIKLNVAQAWNGKKAIENCGRFHICIPFCRRWLLFNGFTGNQFIFSLSRSFNSSLWAIKRKRCVFCAVVFSFMTVVAYADTMKDDRDWKKSAHSNGFGIVQYIYFAYALIIKMATQPANRESIRIWTQLHIIKYALGVPLCWNKKAHTQTLFPNEIKKYIYGKEANTKNCSVRP